MAWRIVCKGFGFQVYLFGHYLVSHNMGPIAMVCGWGRGRSLPCRLIHWNNNILRVREHYEDTETTCLCVFCPCWTPTRAPLFQVYFFSGVTQPGRGYNPYHCATAVDVMVLRSWKVAQQHSLYQWRVWDFNVAFYINWTLI